MLRPPVSMALFFHPRINTHPNPPLQLVAKTIAWVTSYKYLGDHSQHIKGELSHVLIEQRWRSVLLECTVTISQ